MGDKLINDRQQAVLSREGFIEQFWKDLRELQRKGVKATQEDVFDMLEEEYENITGRPLFPSFDAFRKYRNRRIRK